MKVAITDKPGVANGVLITVTSPQAPELYKKAHGTTEEPTEEQVLMWALQLAERDTHNPSFVDRSTLPEMTFYEAWRRNEAVVEVDLEAAKEMVAVGYRIARKPLLEELDGELFRAQEMEDTAEVERLKAEKQKLRDLPAHPSIWGATSTEELEALVIDGIEWERAVLD